MGGCGLFAAGRAYGFAFSRSTCARRRTPPRSARSNSASARAHCAALALHALCTAGDHQRRADHDFQARAHDQRARAGIRSEGTHFRPRANSRTGRCYFSSNADQILYNPDQLLHQCSRQGSSLADWLYPAASHTTRLNPANREQRQTFDPAVIPIRQSLFVLLASVLGAAAQSNVVTNVVMESNMMVAPDLGGITSSNLVQATHSTNAEEEAVRFQLQMDLAIQQRHDKNPTLAAQTLINILQDNAGPEFKRKALFELALAEQDKNDFVKAQQVYSQYMQRYPEDPSAPEVLLRQGLLFRQMGVNTLAISKFYSVMSTALRLRLDKFEYYKNLVLQAQSEIADTYYLQGQFHESADFYTRLLKADSPSLNKQQIEFKLIRSLSYLTNQDETLETINRSQKFLDSFPNDSDVPEVRFILASSYKTVGRNSDALKQVLLLLQSQQENAKGNPELWVYWQRRAGNEIANQLYKEADYLDALQIYQSLAALDTTPAWQAPALYQVGLVYEQLQQWQRASDTYSQITARRTELTGTNAPPSLSSLCEMAQWRKDYIAWLQKARGAELEFQHSNLYKPPSTNTTAAR